MSDTIFYTLKLKGTKTPQELFEKLQKFVKPKGVTKNWVCETGEDGETFRIDFNDEGGSETFELAFDEKNICTGFCKVFFPLDGDAFEDEKKSEFKALLNMLYSARSFFSKMEITDDYALTESFLDSKKYKIVFRELSDEETERARKLVDAGHKTVREFVLALLFDLRGLDYADDYVSHINKEDPNVGDIENAKLEYEYRGNERMLLWAFAESFLYETTAYKDEGLLRNHPLYLEGDLNSMFFSVMAFEDGIVTLVTLTRGRAADAKSGQVQKLYDRSFLPLYEAAKDDFEKCALAYRYFVSIYDWIGFRYVGRAEA